MCNASLLDLAPAFLLALDWQDGKSRQHTYKSASRKAKDIQRLPGKAPSLT
jgi:hypothetical protein